MGRWERLEKLGKHHVAPYGTEQALRNEPFVEYDAKYLGPEKRRIVKSRTDSGRYCSSFTRNEMADYVRFAHDQCTKTRGNNIMSKLKTIPEFKNEDVTICHLNKKNRGRQEIKRLHSLVDKVIRGYLNG